MERHGLRAHRRRGPTVPARSSGTSATRGSTSCGAARIEKITRDHSPVGEREDAGELSELEAMRHPRRNEVYRDVGSEPHEPADPEFIDVQDSRSSPTRRCLLCSDGLTDLVDSASINDIVRRWAGRPQMVVEALIDAANDAGGKDNVTVVYVEGEQFAAAGGDLPGSPSEITRRLTPLAPAVTSPRRRAVRLANIVLVAIVLVLTLVRSDNSLLPGAIPIGSKPSWTRSESSCCRPSRSPKRCGARRRGRRLSSSRGSIASR